MESSRTPVFVHWFASRASCGVTARTPEIRGRGPDLMNPLARHASVHSKQRSRSISRSSKCAQSKRCIALLLTTIAFGPVSAPAFAQTSAPLSPAERARIQQEHEEREAEIRRLLEEQRAKSASVP